MSVVVMFFPQSKLTFLRGRSCVTHLLLYGMFSLVLMIVDHHFQHSLPVRHWLQRLTMPVQMAVDVPLDLMQGMHFLFSTRAWLAKENTRLLEKVTLLAGELLQLRSLEQENKELQALLQVKRLQNKRMMLARQVQIATDNVSQQIVLDKGSRDGVTVGQPVVDAKGVVGVVVKANVMTSRVLLLTDPTHGIPVQVLRNGVRAIAEGNGQDGLTLQHIPETVDIQIDDVLMTSGLGGRFTAGYPVGVVRHIHRDQGDPFLHIEVTPLAALDRVEPMLLIFDALEEGSTE